MQDYVLTSGIPLVRVVSVDTLNIQFLLEGIVGKPFKQLTSLKAVDPKNIRSNILYFSLTPDIDNYLLLYSRLVEQHSTLVVVNPVEVSDLMFNGGLLQANKTLSIQYIKDKTTLRDTKVISKYVDVMSGLSLKTMLDAIRICETTYNGLSVPNLSKVRRGFASEVKGIYSVDLDYGHYMPDLELQDWLGLEGKIFKIQNMIPDLIPRGLLLTGDPGVGKSLGSKFLAKKLGVSLYRLDLGSMLNKYVGTCYSDDTEFLTEGGWKLYDDINGGKLATINKNTHALEYQDYTNRTKYIHEGDAYHFKGTRLDNIVSPNHRMFVGIDDVWSMIEAQDLKKIKYQVLGSSKDWEGTTDLEYFKLPRRKGIYPNSKRKYCFDIDYFLEFLGYFISEGHTPANKIGLISVSQNIGDDALRMEKVLRHIFNKVNVVTNRGNNQISGSNADLWYWLRDNVKTYSINARIPREFMALPKPKLQVLFNALMLGDGSYEKVKGRDGAVSYVSASKQLVDDICEIAIKLGYIPKMREVKGQIQKGHSRLWSVYLSPEYKKTINPRTNSTIVTYVGDMVCFTVPNDTLITRRNGCVLVAGNSEDNLGAALKYVESTEPCILLVDEVEKIFNNKEENSVLPRLLAALLWWLQEHNSRVLTILTTNDVNIIPPELYRTGRVDRVIEMNPLHKEADIKDYVSSYLQSIHKKYKLSNKPKLVKAVLEAIDFDDGLGEGIAHSDVTQITTKIIQQHILKGLSL